MPPSPFISVSMSLLFIWEDRKVKRGWNFLSAYTMLSIFLPQSLLGSNKSCWLPYGKIVFFEGKLLLRRTCLKVATFCSSCWNCVGIFLWSPPWEPGWVSRGKTHGNVGVPLRFKLIHPQLWAISLCKISYCYSSLCWSSNNFNCIKNSTLLVPVQLYVIEVRIYFVLYCISLNQFLWL